jgi:hypothetical protein
VEKPNIVLLQETMGRGDVLEGILRKGFKGWEFSLIDSTRLHRGLITSWKSHFSKINSFFLFQVYAWNPLVKVWASLLLS